MSDMKSILERLIIARKNAGLSQSQAAKLIGLNGASSFQPLEEGKASLTLERFLQLCDIYDVNFTWILTGINPLFDPQPVIEAMEKLKADRDEISDMLEFMASMR